MARGGVAEIFNRKLSVTKLGKFNSTHCGGVSEWSNEQSWKDCVLVMVPRVRISPPPPKKNLNMNNKYFQKIKRLLEQAKPKLSARHQLEFKNVFGAVGGYLNGRIFISCGKFGLALKLPSETLKNLFDKKIAKGLKYFPNGRIKKEYAVLSKQMLENEKQFKKLLDESLKYALSL